MSLPSTIKESIQGILNELKLIRDPDGNIIFQNVGIWNDTLKRTLKGDATSFLFPACFVEINDTSSQVLGLGISTQDIEIIFHILHQELYSLTSFDDLNSTNPALDQNFESFDYRTYIRHYFTNFNTPNFNTLMFQKEKEDFAHGNIYHWQEIFKTKYTDRSACPFVNGTYIVKKAGTWTIDQQEEFVPNITDL